MRYSIQSPNYHDLSLRSHLQTVQNRLCSLCTHLANILERRTNEDPTPEVIQQMAKCFDIEELMKEETAYMKEQSEKSLRKIAAYAKYV